MEYMSKEKFEEAERIDKLKNKMLKYIMYKKRTEAEVRQKFSDEDENLLEDSIQYFKELNYINDEEYIIRAINEFMALKNLSIKEIVYKICQKGVNKNLIEDYVCKNKDILLEYEIASAKALILKKQKALEEQEIKNFLYKKGYMSDSINIAFENMK